MKEDYTAIAMIIDRSGSMHGIESDTIGGVNSFIEKQKEVEGDASVLMVQFDDNYEVIHDFVDIAKIEELTSKVYFPRGGTALLDAIGRTITDLGNRLENIPEDVRPGKVIVAVLTDGQENQSREYTKEKIKEMITLQEETYKWDFNFISADLNAVDDARRLGFSAGKTAIYAKGATGGTFDALSDKMGRVRQASMDSYNAGEVQDFEAEELSAMTDESED